jgi:membrane fusion protein, multidrug efflux system
VINGESTVSVRAVSLGPTDGPMAAVNSGLSVGERVVIDGMDRLRDGARVTVPGAPGQGQAPAAAAPAHGDHPHNGEHSQNRHNGGGQ